jgi:anthraniloyl-CoA monooxygenase
VKRRRCAVVGGGPAGAYLAMRLAGADAGFDVEVHDDDEDDRGVGIVLDADVVDTLCRRDPPSGAAVRAACQTWDTVHLRLGGATLATGGHVIYGVSRRAFVAVLRERAAELGATVVRRRADPRRLAGSVDVLVGADGAGSAVRRLRGAEHGPRVDRGRTCYLWMRADTRLAAGFCFAQTPAGAFVGHVYPYEPDRSAVVVECRPDAARAAGLFGADVRAVEAGLTRLFAEHLDGAALRASTFPWQPFRTVVNRRWYAGNQVLVGDAAHTAHFSVGSGTRLALEDATALARELTTAPTVDAALARYEASRRPPVTAVQADARGSQLWFEDLDRHLRLGADQLAFALRTRRDVNTFGWLRERDPAFVRRVCAAVGADPRAAGTPVDVDVAPRRMPLRLGPLRLSNRLAVADLAPDPADPPGLALRSGARAAAGPVGSAATGVIRTGPAAGAEDADCVVLAGSWAALRRLLTGVRPAAAHQALGVVVEPETWRPADAGWLAHAADFVVAHQTAGQRVERTRFAEHLRNGFGMTVLLWTTGLDADEADTLIGAGRIDGYVVGARASPLPDRR